MLPVRYNPKPPELDEDEDFVDIEKYRIKHDRAPNFTELLLSAAFMLVIVALSLLLLNGCATIPKAKYGYYREYNFVTGKFEYKWGYHYKLKMK